MSDYATTNFSDDQFSEAFAVFESAQAELNGTTGQSAAFEAPEAEATQGEPSKEEVLAENRRLKSLLAAALASRADGAEAPAPPQTLSRDVEANAHTTPRKRSASRVGDLSSLQAKRVRSTSSALSRPGQGPIETMWSPGVTKDQRVDAALELIGTASGGDSVSRTEGIVQFGGDLLSSVVVTPAESVWSSPAAQMITPPATGSPAKKKPARKSRAKKAEKPQQASLQLQQAVGGGPSVQRPLAELYAADFYALNVEEKCRLLIPLLNGVDPAAFPSPTSSSPPAALAPAISFDITTPGDDVFGTSSPALPIVGGFGSGQPSAFTGFNFGDDDLVNMATLGGLGFTGSNIITPTAEVQAETNEEFEARLMASLLATNAELPEYNTNTTTPTPAEPFILLPQPDMGAARQREALEKSAMLQAQGRRR